MLSALMISLALLALGVAGVVILRGIRVRPDASVPKCVCGYDLSGHWPPSVGDDVTCSECGRIVSEPARAGLHVEQRSRRWAVVCGAIALGLVIVPSLFPVMMLRADLALARWRFDAHSAPRLIQIYRRGELAPETLAEFADAVLAHQRDTSQPLLLDAAEFMVLAHQRGKLDPTRWGLFARQSYTSFSARARPDRDGAVELDIAMEGYRGPVQGLSLQNFSLSALCLGVVEPGGAVRPTTTHPGIAPGRVLLPGMLPPAGTTIPTRWRICVHDGGGGVGEVIAQWEADVPCEVLAP